MDSSCAILEARAGSPARPWAERSEDSRGSGASIVAAGVSARMAEQRALAVPSRRMAPTARGRLPATQRLRRKLAREVWIDSIRLFAVGHGRRGVPAVFFFAWIDNCAVRAPVLARWPGSVFGRR